jgi:hypothetical protein
VGWNWSIVAHYFYLYNEGQISTARKNGPCVLDALRPLFCGEAAQGLPNVEGGAMPAAQGLHNRHIFSR